MVFFYLEFNYKQHAFCFVMFWWRRVYSGIMLQSDIGDMREFIHSARASNGFVRVRGVADGKYSYRKMLCLQSACLGINQESAPKETLFSNNLHSHCTMPISMLPFSIHSQTAVTLCQTFIVLLHSSFHISYIGVFLHAYRII